MGPLASKSFWHFGLLADFDLYCPLRNSQALDDFLGRLQNLRWGPEASDAGGHCRLAKGQQPNVDRSHAFHVVDLLELFLKLVRVKAFGRRVHKNPDQIAERRQGKDDREDGQEYGRQRVEEVEAALVQDCGRYDNQQRPLNQAPEEVQDNALFLVPVPPFELLLNALTWFNYTGWRLWLGGRLPNPESQWGALFVRLARRFCSLGG